MGNPVGYVTVSENYTNNYGGGIPYQIANATALGELERGMYSTMWLGLSGETEKYQDGEYVQLAAVGDKLRIEIVDNDTNEIMQFKEVVIESITAFSGTGPSKDYICYTESFSYKYRDSQVFGKYREGISTSSENCRRIYYDFSGKIRFGFSHFFLNLECEKPGNYTANYSSNGNIFSSTTFSIGLYRPKAKVTTSKSSIKPSIPTYSIGESTEIIVSVFDDTNTGYGLAWEGRGCGAPMPNESVTLISEIESHSGGHKHFGQDNEMGTGTFESATGETGVSITSVTDIDGELRATYKAGEYGVKENISAIVADSSSANQVIHSEPAVLEISVPGLVPLDTSGNTYKLAGTFSTPCDIQHNESATIRNSHYVQPDVFHKVEALNHRYNQKTGNHLSLNDASLPYGGVFDDGVSDRSQTCHVSHRYGRDIDVNGASRPCEGKDVSTNNLNCTVATGKYATEMPRRTLLDEIVNNEMYGEVVIEDTIHYRF